MNPLNVTLYQFEERVFGKKRTPSKALGASIITKLVIVTGDAGYNVLVTVRHVKWSTPHRLGYHVYRALLNQDQLIQACLSLGLTPEL